MRAVHAILLLAIVSLPLRAAETDPSFHLYLLVGQSNMAGRGVVDDEGRTSDPRVLMLAEDLKWVPATDPLHFDKPSAGVGPGLAFAKRMAAAHPQARIGLIPCAVGGTSIKAWTPGAADAATKTHPYDDMLARAKAAQQAGVLTGILWHQGEADRGDCRSYGAALTALVARLRQDLSAPQVPFIAGELTPFTPKVAASCQAFNEVLQGLKPQIPRFAVVSGAGLDHKGDELHYNAQSARTLGGRYAEAMLTRLQAR